MQELEKCKICPHNCGVNRLNGNIGRCATFKGNTSNVTVKLGDCSGFTQISDMQIKYISATDSEKTQILNLLTSGVYF